MNIHEYQAKEIFKAFGIPVLPGAVASSADEAVAVAQALRADKWMIKSQIHAGGRGAGYFEGGDQSKGGVRKAESISEVREIAAGMLHHVLITPQTGPGGREVSRVYVEEYHGEVEKEIYLAMLVDRHTGRLTLIASASGGEDIESVESESILKLPVDVHHGPDRSEVNDLARQLGLESRQEDGLNQIAMAMYEIFVKRDASLVEINPLGINNEGDLVALDAIVTLDDNALFRHPESEELRDKNEFQVGELEAAQHGLNYVKLNGNIGCLASGAGLSLATIDAIKLIGGEPANFLDVPPVAEVGRVSQALKLVLTDPQVDSVLINVFGGGIMRCDTIADALIMVNRESPITLPLVVRLAGTNANFAIRRLKDMGPPVYFADNLADASERAVAVAKKTEKAERKKWWERVVGAGKS